MSERLRNTVYLVFMAVAAVALVALVATAPGANDRVEALGSRIRCPVCQGEAIIDSPAPMARDMMDLIRQRVADDVDDEQIIAEITASYSGAVLLDPPTRGATLWLWLAPLLALAAGIGVILWWRRSPETAPTPTAPLPRSRSRAVAGSLLMAVVLGAVVAAAGFALQDREGPAAGAADLGSFDLSQVSNETMEAVIAANLDDPRIDGMRLALAERYFDAGDYRSAFPHYLAVAESEDAGDELAHNALVRLAWMAFDGNGEVDAAMSLLDQALAIDPESALALYLKGQVLWCGANRPAQAAELFREVLDLGGLEGELRNRVEVDLEAANQGEQCP
ncbi:MAG: cytochrome c-type biogenesis protein CcmH [Acidimicrobiia bacterium]